MLVLSNQFFSVSALSLKLEWMVACFFSFAWLVVHLYKRICVCVSRLPPTMSHDELLRHIATSFIFRKSCWLAGWQTKTALQNYYVPLIRIDEAPYRHQSHHIMYYLRNDCVLEFIIITYTHHHQITYI